jgi:hypothetical protein
MESMYKLNKEEQQTLDGVKNTPYMHKTVELIEKFVQEYGSEPQAVYKKAFDEIFRILNEAKNSVDVYLSERKARNEMSLPAASGGEARSVRKFIIWGVYYQFL